MRKSREHRKAVELRRLGLSYREVQEHVPVARSTLSLWLRNVVLSPERMRRLAEKKLEAASGGGRKVHANRLRRVERIMAHAQEEGRQRVADGDRLWLVGTALYWAEGNKPKEWRTAERVAFTNTDASMVILIREWLRRCCAVLDMDIAYTLYLHPSANVSESQSFWCEELGINPDLLPEN